MKHIFIILLAAIMLLALLPSCGDKTTTPTTAAQPTATTPATTTSPATTTPAAIKTPTPTADTVNKDFVFASTMASFFYDLNAIQNYYDDGLTAMAGFELGAGTAATNVHGNRVLLVSYVTSDYESKKKKIPPEFSEKLPPDGSIPAPPGACPAAAEPTSKFKTKGGDFVTPDLLTDKDINTIPTEWINVSQDDPDSLFAKINELVPVNDIRLGDAEGWNTLLWDKLKELQEPAESLMDYQMWNTGADLEQQVIESFRQSLIDKGVPQRVIDAFDASDTTGWYSGSQPAEDDALAQMDITAKLTGSITGTVHEWRDFSISGLGEAPEFGPQRGDGIVTMEIPDVGKVDCSVDINLDQFDELGRAIGGTVVADAIDYEGFQVIFTYKPDGSKDGVVYKDGEPVGELTMTVDHEKFENYIDIKEGTELKLPEDTRTVFQ